MTSIKYEDVFSDFLGRINDYDIVKLSISDAYELMREYLHKSLKSTYVRRLFSTLKLNDEVNELKYELVRKTNEDQDIDFVTNIISMGMIIEWLSPIEKKKSLLSQFFGGKEQNMFSQASHLKEVRELLNDTKRELKNEIKDRGFIYNSYLGN